ncbi:SinR family protein [Microbacterium sp. CFBP 13617]|uniref:SinR family protein n=1 Tax=Microbacterium sp. CFBP 13617 TaxID=2774035 RepID=UPI001780FBB9|nr:SinR family protein [Microbacterium sp. CFBP 13617]MBD8218217.1 SinR family protein [Microbacterium sp. CFBP 13617]
MAKYLLSYDLSSPVRNYDDLIKHLESTYGADGHVLESVWLIDSQDSIGDVRDAAREFIDANDKLMVVALKENVGHRWATANLDSVSRWFKGH